MTSAMTDNVQVTASSSDIPPESAKRIYARMNDIRHFENKVRECFAKGEIPGFVHLYAGEEAVAVPICEQLTDSDQITSTHRGHGHCVAKGCELNGMMAEIYGRATGLCKGKGGSMHIADVSKGMLGANGMVGGGLPLAVGAALRNRTLKTGDITVCFFGDGAANEGTFHESLNLASIWKLPVVFVCENNGFGEATPQRYASASPTIAERASAYNMPGAQVDGKSVVDVYTTVGEAIERARNGEGPSLIECRTYRMYGHFEGDEQTYKASAGDEKAFADKDCIPLFKEYAIKHGLFSQHDAEEIEEASAERVEEALRFAQDSPLPSADSLFEDVFS